VADLPEAILQFALVGQGHQDALQDNPLQIPAGIATNLQTAKRGAGRTFSRAASSCFAQGAALLFLVLLPDI
jgi:hypothetical protein